MLQCPEAPSTSLGSEASGMDHHTVENVYCGQMNQYFRYFFGRNGRRVLRTKEEKDHPDCYPATSPKARGLSWYGVCVSALGKGNLHFCDGTINAEKYIEILEHNMLPSRRHLFQGRPCIFQQDNAKPHSAHITILKRKMRQRRPRTVAHLKDLFAGRMGQNYT